MESATSSDDDVKLSPPVDSPCFSFYEGIVAAKHSTTYMIEFGGNIHTCIKCFLGNLNARETCFRRSRSH